ncbi:lectin-like domain-containing protein [Companilactobacillus futsaii]|uniref:WxL domain-containing protein n=1 Tax=Companilactobacillus futsaii TaxID=938155 RepID=A0A5B7T0J6_9LACO|nr:hypothetical protein [Companilactobacillus futsaii]QCX23755.1 hypothetical protein FG051_00950 [Companilactobacillus futsaii]
MRKQNYGYLIIILFSILTFFISPLQVLADSGTALEEAKAGARSAPDNLGLDGAMFTKADFSQYGSRFNSANLVDANLRTGGDSRAILMTSQPSQVGAIWSNLEGGNYVDITKKQTMSMWMYFGPKKHTDGKDFGDGMAFVLQKSSDGANAIAHDGSSIGTGESLGVWGIDDNRDMSTTAGIAATAIQNSWALEFDTHTNNDASPSNATYFDKGVSGQHIAYGYPGDSETYTRSGSSPVYLPIIGTYVSGGYYYRMNHEGTKQVDLHDGTWHHLTVTWDPVKFQATCVFNDKNPDGSIGTNPVEIDVPSVKAAEFGGYDNLSDHKLRWGFTATTGSAYEANLIAFESIPSSVEGDATPSITDTTQQKEVASNGTVNSNDQLAIKYNLKYDSGRDKWSNINAQVVLPENVTYQTGNYEDVIGSVDYGDGQGSEPIYASELTGTNTLDHILKRNLDSSDRGGPTTATITINGVANNVTTNTDVASVRSTINSDTLIKDVDMLPFTILKSKPINLVLDKNNISVNPNKSAPITGTVSYVDGTAITNSEMTVHANLNGTDLDNFKMSNDDASGKLNFEIPADKLTEDTNILKVYVTDPNGNKTATSTVKISKRGALALKVDNYSFGSINQVASSILIPRKGDWKIMVDDSREKGSNPWNLSAKTGGLYDSGAKFNGNVIYKNANGIEKVLNNNSKTLIANGSKTQEGEQVTNVSQMWNDSEGLLLRSNGSNISGNYSGEMNWVLSDTI